MELLAKIGVGLKKFLYINYIYVDKMEGLLAKMVKMDFSNVYLTSGGIKNLIKTLAIKAKGSFGL